MSASYRPLAVSRFLRPILGLLLLCGLAAAPTAVGAADREASRETTHLAILDKPAPENLDDLKAMQSRVQDVVKKVLPCTVGLRIGSASGSGVIIRPDGYILTAGHVSSQPDREVTVIFSDGRKVKGKTLGANHGIDSGMVKIMDEGPWPYVEMGKSSELKAGNWCLALGHPGGYKPGRTPVVRLGRVLEATSKLIQTDCTLMAGDSGGPLFDLQGRVIGIHSRIGGELTANIHVPVDTYRTTWDRLVKAEVWGRQLGGRGGPGGTDVGMLLDTESKDCRITEIRLGGPANKAGLKVDDVITQFDGQKIHNSDDLVSQLRQKRAGDEVVVQVQRGSEQLRFKLQIEGRGRRPTAPPG